MARIGFWSGRWAPRPRLKRSRSRSPLPWSAPRIATSRLRLWIIRQHDKQTDKQKALDAHVRGLLFSKCSAAGLQVHRADEFVSATHHARNALVALAFPG